MKVTSFWCSVALAALTVLNACSVDDYRPSCRRNADCLEGWECYLGFCVMAASGGGSAADSGNGGDGGSGGRSRGGRGGAGSGGASGRDITSAPNEVGGSGDDAGTSDDAGTDDPAMSCGEPMMCYGAARQTMGVGKCKAGVRSCVDGVLGNCTGSVLPQAETCANQGADDDCNGKADDIPNLGATCAPTDPRACGQGTQRCSGGAAALSCVTERMKRDETCNREDDDCDGDTDEDFDLQNDRNNCGACGTACSDGQSCCNGACVASSGDNGCGSCGMLPSCAMGTICCGGQCLDVSGDRRNCGRCGRTCEDGESCCGGRCVDTDDDAKNCGSCGTACGRGRIPGCCNAQCVDLVSNNNCGGCGTSCGLLGGILCSCEQEGESARCRGALLDLCF